MKTLRIFAIALVSLMTANMAYARVNNLTVTVVNPSRQNRPQSTVELNADSILQLLGSKFCYVKDIAGNEIPSQVTYDGKLIFQSSLALGASAEYTVSPSSSRHDYPKLTSGRRYPERADDVAWENELVGFRLYGPKTQAKGEKAYGYDLFFKHENPEQVLETLYADELNPANWAKMDSLKKISNKLAREFKNTFTYHKDHGKGMDCYAVGPTLGDGCTAFVVNDSLSYTWCYEKERVLDNGPLRFTVELEFAPRTIGKDNAAREHRIISLDAGSHLNHTKVWLENVSEPKRIVTGFPLRDEMSPVVTSRYLAYSDPTQGNKNGRAMVGLVTVNPFGTTSVKEKHILGQTEIPLSECNSDSTEPFEYYWGYSWHKPTSSLPATTALDSWRDYLSEFSENLAAPLLVIVSAR